MPAETNSVAITHGLDGTLVAPDWPPLTLDKVRGLLRYYPSLGHLCEIPDNSMTTASFFSVPVDDALTSPATRPE